MNSSTRFSMTGSREFYADGTAFADRDECTIVAFDHRGDTCSQPRGFPGFKGTGGIATHEKISTLSREDSRAGLETHSAQDQHFRVAVLGLPMRSLVV